MITLGRSRTHDPVNVVHASQADLARRLEMDNQERKRPEFGSRNALLRCIAIGTRANHLILTEDAWSR